MSVHLVLEAVMVFQGHVAYLDLQATVNTWKDPEELMLGKPTGHVAAVIQDKKYAVVSFHMHLVCKHK